MLEIACIVVTLVCLLCCVACVLRCKHVKAERDYYYEYWVKAVNDLGKACDLNSEIIKRCENIIKNNEILIDINADLRLELNKMKENNNA